MNLDNLFSYTNVPAIATIAFILLGLVVVGVWRSFSQSKKKIEEDLLEQLKVMESMSSGKDIEEKAKAKNPITWWTDKWGTSMHAAGVMLNYSKEQCGAIVAAIIGVIYLLAGVITQSFGIGFVIVGSGLVFASIWLRKKAKERKDIFEDQIEPFLSMLKSNVQAGETPERALVAAIDLTTDPLQSELRQARALIETGTFQSALRELRKTTTNDTLRFLCGCIEISSTVGANLEDQIEVIEDLIANKARIRRQLDVAESKHIPLLMVSAILIPGIFIYTYMSSDSAKAFWFNSLGSWLAFGAAFFVYGLGLFIINKMIENTSKF